MTKRTLILLTLTLMLLPGAVLAGGGHRKQRQRYERYERPYNRVTPIEILAQDLEEGSRMTYRAARRGVFYASHRQRRTLKRLRELKWETRRFRRQVELYGYAPARIEQDFARLERKFVAAARSLEASRGFHPAVWNRFGEMSRSMRRVERAVYGSLDYAYARPNPWRSPRRHHARVR